MLKQGKREASRAGDKRCKRRETKLTTRVGVCDTASERPRVDAVAAIPVPPPKPNLAPPIRASFKGTILLRRESGIFVVRGGDKFARRVLKDVYSASLSPDSRQVAYFGQKQVRLLTLAADGSPESDTVLEELPGARVDEIGWSADGAMLAYEVLAQTNSGVHVLSLATHAVRRVSASAGGISFSADGKYVLGTDARQGLTRYRLSDGSSEVVYRTPFPPTWAAKFSSAGSVGVLVPVPQSPSDASDDEPDCTGAQLQLDIVEPSKAWTVPFPKGFDDVYDFDFSPDGRQVVVGFGTVGCDYPGDSGAVYLVSLPGRSSRRLTPTGIALKGRFSPDGKQVAYTDFTVGNSPSVFILDLASGKAAPLIAPDEFGMDEALDWQ